MNARATSSSDAAHVRREEQPTLLERVDGLLNEVNATGDIDRVDDRAYRRDNSQPFEQRPLLDRDVLKVQSQVRWNHSARIDIVGARQRQFDPTRIDIAQVVTLERSDMAEHAP